VQEPDSMEAEMNRLRDILNCKYQPADLDKISKNCDNLTDKQQRELNELLTKTRKTFSTEH